MRTVLVLALLAAGCATAEPPPSTAAAPRATAASAPAVAATVAASPSPSVLLRPPPEPEPALVTTGEDYLAVLRSVEEYRSWLFRNPDPTRLAAVFDERCSCYATDAERLAQHAERGEWWTGAPPTVIDVEVMDGYADDLVTLRATSTRDGTSWLVDAAGAVIDTRSSRGSWLTDYVLVREGPSAPWRVRDVVLQGDGES